MGKSMAITVRLLGFPITIGPVFPLFLLLLGYISRLSGIGLAIWVIFGTIAILLHELGHAVAFRHYGLESSIRFWGLGGLAVPNDQEAAARLPDRQWLVVSLAGPSVGLVLGAIGVLIQQAVAGQGPDVRSAAWTWTFVNLGWGIFNLVPITGLDGGQAVMHLLMVALGERGRVVALAASIAFSTLVAVVALENRYVYLAFIAILFGLVNPYQYRLLFVELFPGLAKRLEQRDAELKQLRSWRYTFEEEPGRVWPGDDREPGSRS